MVSGGRQSSAHFGLIFEERVFASGYGPRSILVAAGKDSLYVGGKDGWITVVEVNPEAKSDEQGLSRFHDWRLSACVSTMDTAGTSGIRALCELDDSRLLAGLVNGDATIVAVDKNTPPELLFRPRPAEQKQLSPIRAVGVSKDGVVLIAGPSIGYLGVEKDRTWEFEPLGNYPQDVRFVQPLEGKVGGKYWVFVTDRGEVRRWDGSGTSLSTDTWLPWGGDHPGLLNDFALLRNDRQRAKKRGAAALFLSTDSGVYLLRPDEHDPSRACTRISLPGLGTMPTALSYAEIEGEHGGRFLWVADARGDSHLFVALPNQGLVFRRSGVRHSLRETLLCFLWVPQAFPTSLLCGQARRNDQIVLGLYWNPDGPAEPKVEPSEPVHLRRLLNHGRWNEQRGSIQVKPSAETWTEELRRGIRNLDRPESTPLTGAALPPSRWKEQVDDWPPEALLTELYERLGEQENTRSLLIDAIRSPQAEIPDELLASGLVDTGAARMWTQALLGIIHRSKGDRQLAHLGLLRWLRSRQNELRKRAVELPNQTNPSELIQGLQQDIGFARKWGLHGEANASRQNLVGPIQTLLSQGADDPDSPLALDYLTYQTLLLNRRVSLMDQRVCDQLRGRTAWSVCLRKIAEDYILAVSWMWGGVELFRLRQKTSKEHPDRFEPLARFLPPPHGSRSPPEPEAAKERLPSGERLPCGWKERTFHRQKHGYSRVVHLGQALSGHWFLLYSPTSPADQLGGQGDPEVILLWWLKEWRPAGDAYMVRLPRGQSVYSLLELAPGSLLLGLRGDQGNASVGLLRVRATNRGVQAKLSHQKSLVQNLTDESDEGSDGASMRRNRVWSLACDPRAMRRSTIWVSVGCEGGQIYRLPVKLEEREPLGEGHLVDQMNSPVRSLLCCDRRERSPLRIYAGAEDGTIMAWQQRESAGEEPRKDEPAEKFATLWATQEQGPVAALHRVRFNDPKPDEETDYEESERSVILAITRQGRAVLVDDRPSIDPPDPPDRRRSPRRAPVPGSRFGRYTFPVSVWGSALLDSETFIPPFKQDTGAVCALLTASGDGTLSLFSLHSPSKSNIRKERYSKILALGPQIVEKGPDCRLGEAVLGAVPSLSWILVRWILDPAFTDDPKVAHLYPKPESVQARWLPRHLRPLLAVNRAWIALEGDQSLPQEHSKAMAETAGSALSAALERAWHLEDLHLYQEICSMALKRANFTLYRSFARKGAGGVAWQERKNRIALLYEEIYRAIESSLPSWLGAGERQEARARVVVAKQMVDGDTIWKLSNEAAAEALSEVENGPYLRILKLRVSGVRELLHKRDPMVSLEALRAANLSLMRLCRRLIQERQKTDPDPAVWRPRGSSKPSAEEVHWPIFKDYFKRLTVAAARMFHTRLELTDAIAHEYSRTFALVICACPSATIRIANRLTETLLIRDLESEYDLSRRVLHQLDVLSDIGLPCPRWAHSLFEHVTSMPQPGDGYNPMSAHALERLGVVRSLAEGAVGPKSARDRAFRRRFGYENTQDLYHLSKLYRVIDEFVQLTNQFVEDARGIEFGPQKLTVLKRELKRVQERDDAYRDSRRFWLEIVGDLHRDLTKFEKSLGSKRSEAIRPEVVLWSPLIERWATKVVQGRLKRLERGGALFLPELNIYRNILNDLADAARSFPTSAAVVKNLVGGILGHHLLENLDEHILELEEIAQALDPVGVRSTFRTDGGKVPPPLSTAQRFARYLVRRAEGAESIPKNLRVLHTMLTADLRRGPADSQLTWLLDQHEWQLNGNDITISQAEMVALGIVLEELAQNDERHSGLEESEHPSPKLLPITGSDGIELWFPFRSEPGDESNKNRNHGRLLELERNGLQTTFLPKQSPDVGSTGSGLYLANMAAAVVGWKLWIKKIKKNKKAGGDLAWCRFGLAKRWPS
jgi:hypothetical protein